MAGGVSIRTLQATLDLALPTGGRATGKLWLSGPLRRDLPDAAGGDVSPPGLGRGSLDTCTHLWTPMMAGMDQKIQDALAAAIPFPSRLGTPADYASLVLELARNVYINGECIRLDGAIRLAPR